MYTELNSLLEQNVIDDAWYDDGFLVAQDIIFVSGGFVQFSGISFSAPEATNSP